MDSDRTLLDRSLDALDDIFYVYDDRARLVYWNQRLNDLFALDDADLYGMAADEFFVEADRPVVAAAVAELFDEGETVVEVRAETTEGRRRLQLTGRRLTDDDGAILGFAGIGRDVTEARAAEQRLERQNERLDEFVGVVSHDLRSPLGVLDGALALAEETGDPAAFERARHAAERMEALIDDLLALARKGEWVENVRPVALDTLARSCWTALDTEDGRLVVDTDRAIMADANRLYQLFENLYRNAVVHGRGEDRPLTVTVGTVDDGFFVADTGPGIPDSARTRVFETGYTTDDAGTGFGLTIVDQIAKAHGWEVSVTDPAGGGARFASAASSSSEAIPTAHTVR
ncbi:PAS domain-containing protein [Halapricum sp. CBA1109]|uniref:sensor histidine kinase n=1 Tax=Halapricum sp. CBA1109 TaxID=2668068 RepID=UPI0012FCC61E|nr:PAS domain-containing sensor histidine kinase [Halapricum sp. CBA1109]MUV88648.1 PAS domain-containing protein [Halapricum sp. CBA1109]